MHVLDGGAGMAGSVVASINFYSTEKTAIHSATLGTTEGDEIEAELACLSLFACRSLINLGAGLPADTLANLMTMMSVEGLAELTLHDSKEHWLVPFRGPAKQRFDVSLNMDPLSFRVNIKGFGIRGKGLNWHGFTAVTSLNQHFCRSRRSSGILVPLSTILFQIGAAYQSDALCLANQHDVALTAWAMGLAEMDEGMGPDGPIDLAPSAVRRRREPLRARGRY